MKLRILGMSIIAAIFLIQACKPGYNRSKRPPSTGQKPPECAQSASNVNLSRNAEQVFKLLADLTCFQQENNGNLMGQGLGSGRKVFEEESDSSYEKLVDQLKTNTGKTPTIISTDYALDERYDALDLAEVNATLELHWLKGGLVTISWSPMNPWLDEDSTEPSDNVNLASLVDPNSAIFETWAEYLLEVGNALESLRNKGIVVLWRPLPEMNSDRFWWGTDANINPDDDEDARLYLDVWNQMYNYLNGERNLNNLLWVYSPLDLDSTAADADAPSSTWAYPGENWTDIVAPVVRTDSLQIREYDALLELGHPFGVAQWGPSTDNTASIEKRFDATLYSDRLQQSYPFVAFWLAPYSQQVNETQRSYTALVDLTKINDLLKRGHNFALEDAIEYGLLAKRGTVETSSSSSSSSSSAAEVSN